MKTVELLADFLLSANREKASSLIDDWVTQHGIGNVLVEILTPALRMMGDLWEKEDVSIAQAYVASKITDEVLANLSESLEGRVAGLATKGPVVLGNAEDDCHPLGRKIVAAFLRADGWLVHDLGYDVEPKKFVDRAITVGAKVIGVSAMMYTTAENVRAVRAEINGRGLQGRIQLALGGAVFRLRPELVEQFGGDGTAADASGASELFGKLWNRAERGCGADNE